jgi:hypothetical protein
MLGKAVRNTALVLLAVAMAGAAAWAQTSTDPVTAAIELVKALDRPGRDNLATVWDGNKYIQCRRMADHSLRCEAAGGLMQPSLQHLLTPERIGHLAAMGWMLDPSFGNYAQVFKKDVTAPQVADKIRTALAQVYDANMTNLEVETTSIRSEPCPPRHGPSQNLAGMISDAPSMARYSIHACAYKPRDDGPEHLLAYGVTTADLIGVYGPRVTLEIQRLRINMQRRVFVIFDAGIGYVQCGPQARPDGFYCEAQSADSWPALASVLTPDRIARLHAAGYADPGRAPNFSKTYPADAYTDTAVAAEILTILHDVYGYYGATRLAIKTEEG